MKYNVAVNKRYHYVKVYAVLKRANENVNPLSRALASLIDRLVSGGGAKGAG